MGPLEVKHCVEIRQLPRTEWRGHPERNVDLYSKNLNKVLKAKAIKDNTSHFNLATSTVRGSWTQFKAVLPLVLALRNPGMKERHWKVLSDKLPYNFSLYDEGPQPADAADTNATSLHCRGRRVE